MLGVLRILYIEDSEDDAILVTRSLKKSGLDLTYTRVQNEEEMIEQLTYSQWDLIICDYAMPNFDAMTALQTVQELELDIPFIVVSGTIGEEQAVALMKSGAHDYIMKDRTARLAPAVQRELKEVGIRKLKKEAEIQLRKNESKFRTLAENSLDYIMRITDEGHISYANERLARLLSDTLFSIVGKNITTLHMLIPKEESENAIAEVITEQAAVRKEVQTSTGEWVEWQFVPEYDATNQISSIMLVGRDSTKRKSMEMELRYISYHDPLTGLFNRVYLEEQMHQLDRMDAYPIGVIVCDIDGLKMINDSLGHEVGDTLLQAVSELITASLPKDTIIARVGGDEFAIVMQNVDMGSFKQSIEVMYQAIEDYNETNDKLPISLSIGHAYTTGKDTVIDMYREADNHMYRIKLHKAQSTRSGIVQLLIKALEARDFETEKHMERMEELVVLIGEKINLPEAQITDMRLFARFHDIGKVGIPDEILFKPGSLTGSEYKIMQTHSDIGYRVARSASELKHISDFILQHHEWWNGEGYPSGTRKDMIPIECRILAIADAYDAMTSDRPYRKALSKELALKEIEKQRGIQFDPELVDIFIGLKEEL